MYSISFPDMLASTTTNLVADHEATSQNLILLLKSDRKSLFGDPYFGSSLRTMLFDQNNLRIRDIIIDEIYTTIATFMPQIRVKRSDITITSSKADIYVNIKATNLIDYQINLYSIKLTEDDSN